RREPSSDRGRCRPPGMGAAAPSQSGRRDGASSFFQTEREKESRTNELELSAVDDGLGPGQELVRKEHAPVVRLFDLVVDLVDPSEPSARTKVVRSAEGGDAGVEGRTVHDVTPSP